jgi:hypothetical protein
VNYLDLETAKATESLKLKQRTSSTAKLYQRTEKLINASFRSSIGSLNCNNARKKCKQVIITWRLVIDGMVEMPLLSPATSTWRDDLQAAND